MNLALHSVISQSEEEQKRPQPLVLMAILCPTGLFGGALKRDCFAVKSLASALSCSVFENTYQFHSLIDPKAFQSVQFEICKRYLDHFTVISVHCRQTGTYVGHQESRPLHARPVFLQ